MSSPERQVVGLAGRGPRARWWWATVVVCAGFPAIADGAPVDAPKPLPLRPADVSMARPPETSASAPEPWVTWGDPGEVPLPAWARSVEILRNDEALSIVPGGSRRGLAVLGARLPLLGRVRGPGCVQRWLLVGPLAYVCTDKVRFSPEAPFAGPPPPPLQDALPYRYFVVRQDGASTYARPADAEEGSPVEELEPGWFVATTAEVVERGQRFEVTRRGHYVARSQLVAVSPSPFQGYWLGDGHGLSPAAEASASHAPRGTPAATAESVFDVAWVMPERIDTYAEPAMRPGKPTGMRGRLERVKIEESRQIARGDGKSTVGWLRIGAAEWIRESDVRRPTRAAPPAELRGAERWIDVDTGSQTLVAYEGDRAVFATVVSTGRAATPTPKGTYRIWVKLRTSTMSNVDDSLVDNAAPTALYSIQDVPWVQYFSHGVALHAAFWHRRYGTPYSHGCVNLAPHDALALFTWTMPHMPSGWEVVFPTVAEPATLVRVR